MKYENGFLSVGLLMVIISITTLMAPMINMIIENNKTIYAYQQYIKQYYAVRSCLILARDQIQSIPPINFNTVLSDKAFLYTSEYPAYQIEFNGEVVRIVRFEDYIIGVLKRKKMNRMILLGVLSPDEHDFDRIYAMSFDNF